MLCSFGVLGPQRKDPQLHHHHKYLSRVLQMRSRQLPVRVTTLSPGFVETEFEVAKAYGDTATAKSLYSGLHCLQPADVAQAILWALAAPPHMEVNDILVRPTEQATWPPTWLAMWRDWTNLAFERCAGSCTWVRLSRGGDPLLQSGAAVIAVVIFIVVEP